MPANILAKQKIDPGTLKPHGKIRHQITDKKLVMTVLSANPLSNCKNTKNPHYLELPGQYKLPFRIDIKFKIEEPAFYIQLGNGHVNFGTHWSDNHVIDDICEPQMKPRFFNTHIPMNKFAEISLIYGFKEMQINVNGEERFYSAKERYMKSPLLESMNSQGFPVRISCDKFGECTVQSITVTEFKDTPEIIRGQSGEPEIPIGQGGNKYSGKPDFAACIANLPEPLKNNITGLDEYLRGLRPLKFKRTIEKNGNKITYTAPDYGISYAIHPGYDVFYHTLQWYIITAGKPETWHRKDNQMEAVLNYLAETDPEFGLRMFDSLSECIGGYGPGCLAKTPYTFKGKTKITCHGKLRFRMSIQGLGDVKRFISAINELNTR